MDAEVFTETGIVLLLIDGDVEASSIVGKTYLSTGDLLIGDPTRSIRLDGSVGWSAEALYIESRRIAEHVGDRRFPETTRFDRSDFLVDIIRQLWRIGDDLSQVEPEDRLVGTALIDLITRLAIRMVASATEARAPAGVVDTVERARDLIRTHLSDHRFGVADLARRMQVSPRHLSSLFAPFGSTPARTILEMRVERGKELLADPVNAFRQIADIALACGFEDQNYFSRCFRAIVGRPPRDFRNDKDFSVNTLA